MFENLIAALKEERRTIVFTEGPDARILEATARLLKDDLMDVILIGGVDEVKAAAAQGGFDIEKATIIDPANYAEFDEMAQKMFELRKGKMDMDTVKANLAKGNYFGTMLVKMGKADALLGGATYSTADTVRPALQLVKTKPGAHLVSSCFILSRPAKDGGEEMYAMGDCAINISYEDTVDKKTGEVTLTAAQKIAEVAIETAKTGAAFGIDPKVAMLSYSTMGSGKGPTVTMMRDATAAAKELAPEDQGKGFSGCWSGKHLYLPGHQRRQHRLQDRTASGRLRSLRPDSAGSERSDQRPVPWLQCGRGLPDGYYHRWPEVILHRTDLYSRCLRTAAVFLSPIYDTTYGNSNASHPQADL